MKTLMIASILFLSLNANASLNIKSVELNDSTVIDGNEISSIVVNDETSSIELIETNDGDLIEKDLIKKIKFGLGVEKAKLGGEGSGG